MRRNPFVRTGSVRIIKRQFVHGLEVERERARGAVELEAERVPAPRRHPGRFERGERGADLTVQDKGVVDRYLPRSRAAAASRSASSLGGKRSFGHKGPRPRAERSEPLTGQELRNVDHMSTDVTDCAGTSQLAPHPPSERHRRVDQPVL